MSVTPILEAVLLVIALSLDAFAASFAYGSKKIAIPALSVVVISLICTVTLVVALLFGTAIAQLAPLPIMKGISFGILFFLGVVKIFEGSVKNAIAKSDGKKLSFSAFQLRFILNIYVEPERADQDKSRILSTAEAVMLALALSLDGIAVGIGVGITKVSIIAAALFSLFFGVLAIVGGVGLGRRAIDSLPIDLSWLGGILLLVLAFMRL